MNVFPAAGIVDQHHAGDGEAAEGVEGAQALASHAGPRRPKAGSMRRKAVRRIDGSVAQQTQMKKFR